MTCYHRALILIMISCILFNSQADEPFERCAFASEIVKKYKIPKPFIDIWICLTEALRKKEHKKVQMGPAGAVYGLFKIKSGEWCEIGKPGGKCYANCEDFTNDDILDDIKCALVIFEKVGFSYWPEWNFNCRSSQKVPKVEKECNLVIPYNFDMSLLKQVFGKRKSKKKRGKGNKSNV